MLYLEDYLESMMSVSSDDKVPWLKFLNYHLPIVVIEHLPQELRDRFTEMREMDLQVQSNFRISGEFWFLSKQ